MLLRQRQVLASAVFVLDGAIIAALVARLLLAALPRSGSPGAARACRRSRSTCGSARCSRPSRCSCCAPSGSTARRARRGSRRSCRRWSRASSSSPRSRRWPRSSPRASCRAPRWSSSPSSPTTLLARQPARHPLGAALHAPARAQPARHADRGHGRAGGRAAREDPRAPRTSASRVQGLVAADPALVGTQIAGLPVLGAVGDLPGLVERTGAELVYLALARSRARGRAPGARAPGRLDRGGAAGARPGARVHAERQRRGLRRHARGAGDREPGAGLERGPQARLRPGLLGAGTGAPLAGAAGARALGPARLAGPGALRAGARGPEREALPHAQVPHHARGRRGGRASPAGPSRTIRGARARGASCGRSRWTSCRSCGTCSAAR